MCQDNGKTCLCGEQMFQDGGNKWVCMNPRCTDDQRKEVDAIISESAFSEQVGGGHYKKYPIDPFRFFAVNKIPADAAFICKYVLRHQDKNGIDDLYKARHCIDMMIEAHYGSEFSDIRPEVSE